MKNSTEFKLLNEVFDELFPLCRSITGHGIEASMDIMSRYIPLKVEKVPSGTQIFDWLTPPQWNFKRARLWGPDDELICDTEQNNLHIVSYSQPIKTTISLDSLQKHLHSLPDLPDAIPYVTSYYQQTWGFCLTHQQREQLKAGDYRVEIDATFDKQGGVPFAHHTLAGESQREILLTSYLCHPSMANNELSGPLVLLGLYNRISAWPKRRFSYRFLLNPETIGSLCFLSRYNETLQQNLEAGLILTCMGGDVDSLRYKASRRGNTLVDQLAQYESERSNSLRTIPFTPINGSDERQYCAPGFNLPVAQVSRSLNMPSMPYHTSLDTKETMSIARIIESIDYLENFLKLAEISGNAVNQSPFGEPQLGKRGLYPNLNSLTTLKQSNDHILDGRTKLHTILTLLNELDGHTSVLAVAKKLGLELETVAPIVEELESHQLLKFNTEPLF